MSWKVIWLVLISLYPDGSDQNESFEDRARRMKPYAVAIADATKDPETQAAMVAAGNAETRFAENVMRGECRPGGCDEGKAKGVWQLHPWCKASLDPLDVFGQAVCARKALRGPFARCGTWEKAFGGYAAGHGCRPWPDREVSRKRILRQMFGLQWKEKQGILEIPILPEKKPERDPEVPVDVIVQSGNLVAGI